MQKVRMIIDLPESHVIISPFVVLLTPSVLSVCFQPSAIHLATFTCKTTNTGALLWIPDNHDQQSHFATTSNNTVGDTGSLGDYFTTRLVRIEGLNLTSTATTDVLYLPSNISNITIMCDDNGDTLGAESAMLIVLGKLIRALCLGLS